MSNPITSVGSTKRAFSQISHETPESAENGENASKKTRLENTCPPASFAQQAVQINQESTSSSRFPPFQTSHPDCHPAASSQKNLTSISAESSSNIVPLQFGVGPDDQRSLNYEEHKPTRIALDLGVGTNAAFTRRSEAINYHLMKAIQEEQNAEWSSASNSRKSALIVLQNIKAKKSTLASRYCVNYVLDLGTSAKHSDPFAAESAIQITKKLDNLLGKLQTQHEVLKLKLYQFKHYGHGAVIRQEVDELGFAIAGTTALKVLLFQAKGSMGIQLEFEELDVSRYFRWLNLTPLATSTSSLSLPVGLPRLAPQPPPISMQSLASFQSLQASVRTPLLPLPMGLRPLAPQPPQSTALFQPLQASGRTPSLPLPVVVPRLTPQPDTISTRTSLQNQANELLLQTKKQAREGTLPSAKEIKSILKTLSSTMAYLASEVETDSEQSDSENELAIDVDEGIDDTQEKKS